MSLHLVALKHFPLLEGLHGIARIRVPLQLHQVHKTHVTRSQLPHSPEVAQLQSPVPSLKIRQLLPTEEEKLCTQLLGVQRVLAEHSSRSGVRQFYRGTLCGRPLEGFPVLNRMKKYGGSQGLGSKWIKGGLK